MYTERKPVNTFLVEAYCGDDGGCGKLKYGVVAFMSHTPSFPHACDECGKIQNIKIVYPKEEHEVIK